MVGTKGLVLGLGLEEEDSASLDPRLRGVASFPLPLVSGLEVMVGVEGTGWVGGDILGEGEERSREWNMSERRLKKDEENGGRSWEIYVCDL